MKPDAHILIVRYLSTCSGSISSTLKQKGVPSEHWMPIVAHAIELLYSQVLAPLKAKFPDFVHIIDARNKLMDVVEGPCDDADYDKLIKCKEKNSLNVATYKHHYFDEIHPNQEGSLILAKLFRGKMNDILSNREGHPSSSNA